MQRLIRITTVPLSLEKLLEGQLNFMQEHYKVTAISSDQKRLQRLGTALGVDTFSVEMTREITPGKDMKAVWDLYRYFKKEKPLIVHTHTPKAGIAGMLAAKLAGVPIRLHTVAGLPFLETKGATRKILETVEKLTYSLATRVYPNSHKVCELLIENHFGPRSKFKVIGNGSSNGIDTAYFNPGRFPESARSEFRATWKIPAQDTVFVFVGRLVGDKGINELVEAFAQLNVKYPETSLLLVGPFEQELDPLREDTLKMIQEHPKIFETGYQDDVRPFLAASNVLTFPSYREGFPNVVMQAGAMGLPAIVTDINGCNEIVETGKNGVIIPVRSSEDLFQAMEKMVGNSAFRMELSANSRRMIESKYERHQLWESLLEEYKALEKDFKKVFPRTTSSEV